MSNYYYLELMIQEQRRETEQMMSRRRLIRAVKHKRTKTLEILCLFLGDLLISAGQQFRYWGAQSYRNEENSVLVADGGMGQTVVSCSIQLR